jgi:hypothetical protein
MAYDDMRKHFGVACAQTYKVLVWFVAKIPA